MDLFSESTIMAVATYGLLAWIVTYPLEWFVKLYNRCKRGKEERDG